MDEKIINFNGLILAEKFRITTAGEKRWEFRYDSDGNLTVRVPGHIRYTKVYHPASVLALIARRKKFIELEVQPLPAVEGDAKIRNVHLLLEINEICFAY